MPTDRPSRRRRPPLPPPSSTPPLVDDGNLVGASDFDVEPYWREDAEVREFQVTPLTSSAGRRRLFEEFGRSPSVVPGLEPLVADLRQRAIGVWRNHPEVILFLASNINSSYQDFLTTGTIEIGHLNFVRQTIQSDINAHPEAPAQQWEATHVPNGIYGAPNRTGSPNFRFRVRTASQGGESVRGRRIVQLYGPAGWKAFAFLTRVGTLRLWQSRLADARSAYVAAANRLFDGSPLTPLERHCWLCHSLARGGDGGQMSAEDCGLCTSHINSLPRPPRAPQFNVYGEPLSGLSDREDDEDEDEEEDDDYDYDDEPLPLSRASSRRRAVVHAEMSEVNPEWVR